mmetsp:Transcript_63935/g.93613  ORF Transcript_63935/g.93613 Transcript_63935/m.93613 type:complete len:201 (-) Transcript_63935:48-650(-)
MGLVAIRPPRFDRVNSFARPRRLHSILILFSITHIIVDSNTPSALNRAGSTHIETRHRTVLPATRACDTSHRAGCNVRCRGLLSFSGAELVTAAQAGVELDETNVGITHTSRCLPEGHNSLEYPIGVVFCRGEGYGCMICLIQRRRLLGRGTRVRSLRRFSPAHPVMCAVLQHVFFYHDVCYSQALGLFETSQYFGLLRL